MNDLIVLIIFGVLIWGVIFAWWRGAEVISRSLGFKGEWAFYKGQVIAWIIGVMIIGLIAMVIYIIDQF